MTKITSDSLMSLETYSKKRQEFRTKVIAHKKNRKISLGEHITLLFEDELTVRYQIQEMLRIEKIFDEDGIAQELDAYTPLIPDGNNWKVTMMIEYTDPTERANKLKTLLGVEKKISINIAGQQPVYAIADEDLERETEDKTSAVHFLRFELTPAMTYALKQDASLSISVDHTAYQATTNIVDTKRKSLLNDLTS